MIDRILKHFGYVPAVEPVALEAPCPEALEGSAQHREMKFCQRRNFCKTRELCKLGKRCAYPDHAYVEVEWAEPTKAKDMGREAYRAGLDITFDCPFNGTQSFQHAFAYFRLGYLEEFWEHFHSRMSGSEHGKWQDIRAAMRAELGLERYKGKISGRTLESLRQDRLENEAQEERWDARKPKPLGPAA